MEISAKGTLNEAAGWTGRAGWRQRAFAWMLSKGCGRYERGVAARKQSLLGRVHGDVLEIGPGAGANLDYYPAGIRWMGIEPNPYLHPYLERKAEARGLHAVLCRGVAERLEVANESVDVVVSTLVLCSVRDVARTLEEILRVLRPGGHFVFIEHVAGTQGTLLRHAQRCIRPFCRFVGDGCHPDRETWISIEKAGFGEVHLEHFRAPAVLLAPHIAGTATKKAA